MVYYKPKARPADPILRRVSIFCELPHKKRRHHIKRERQIALEQSFELRAALKRRDGPGCVVCGSQRYLTLDHIIPVSKGGKTELKNLQLLCKRHNRDKGDFIMDLRPEREVQP